MTTQPYSTETLSSQTGRSWLENTQALDIDAQSNPQPPTGTPQVKTVEVALPDVSSFATGETGFDISQTIPPAVVAKLLSGKPIKKDASGDISETPAQWGDQSADGPTTRTSPSKDSQTTNSLGLDGSVDSLCDTILERFPTGDPSVLLFVGAEPNHHIDEATARVAARMAQRNVGRILLLDSDLKAQSLTQASGLDQTNGLSDVTNHGLDWRSLVYTGDSKMLDFIPGGTHQRFRHPEEKSRLRAAVTEMKQDYQFVLVSAGDAHDLSARIWNDICDGSYLLVSMKNSNETFAQSAVAELQSNGARLLGCVLTDVD